MGALQIHDGMAKRDRLVSLFSESLLYEKVMAIPDSLKLKDENELRMEVMPTQTDFALKKSLWRLGLNAFESGLEQVAVVRVFEDCCSKPYFYDRIMNNQPKLAWLFTPESNVETMVEEAFVFGLNRIRKEILTMHITEKTAPIILKAFQYFADRHLGAVTQKIESKSLHVSVDGKTNPALMTKAEIQEKIKELEAAMEKSPIIEIEGRSGSVED